MAHWLRALTAPSEALNSIPSTCGGSQSSITVVSWDQMTSSNAQIDVHAEKNLYKSFLLLIKLIELKFKYYVISVALEYG